MDLKQFNRFCSTLPATHRVVQWGGSHVWKVGDKIFALCGPWGPDREDGSWKIAFKASDMSFQLLTEQSGLIPAPYLGRYKWVQVQEPDALGHDDLKAYLKEAHTIVAGKLSRKSRQEIGLE